ncbi:hypothetical protein [Novosphingobium sp. KACC 22771]|uniref:hypothetical protein n=1 Tax=Novosphingobium sp. KACC 22771 TaxID=3025670 RepID=UPI0023660E92|nr:hypothetical protein [Novosphingobium sp. KACC 22771]WDF74619.1 hypothetical protein PQ467_22035 [Novosphingobium sp. KACC 22771]
MSGTVMAQDYAPVQDKPSLLRHIDWIWHVRGQIPLPPGQSGDETLDRLTPLFRQTGTSHQRHQDTLSFRKKDPAAQDKMSVFDSGVLWVENSLLRYDLISRALLYCFLAPLLFLGFAQAIITINDLQKAPAELTAKAKHKPEAVLPLNPIDKALGAPEPDKPGSEGGDEEGPKSKKPSPTPAYVFAGIFVALYLIGRVLEDRLVKSLFRKTVAGV